MGVIEIERLLERRVSFVRREDLNVAPGETHEFGLEIRRCCRDGSRAVTGIHLGEVHNPLANVGPPIINIIREIGAADRIDLLAGEEDVQDAVHDWIISSRCGWPRCRRSYCDRRQWRSRSPA